MIEAGHRVYPVDGESFANGKVEEYTVIYEREDIVEGIIDSFVEGNDTFLYLGEDEEVPMGTFLDVGEIEEINEEIGRHLIDDEYGSDKHFGLVADLIEQTIDSDVDYEIEIQRYT